MVEKLETQLTQAALEQVRQAEGLGVSQPRLRRQLEERGAASVLADLVRRGQASDGFDALIDQGRGDLTLEALAAQSRFATLFTDEQADHCLSLLCEAGAYHI